jgi:hypothetical protein
MKSSPNASLGAYLDKPIAKPPNDTPSGFEPTKKRAKYIEMHLAS